MNPIQIITALHQSKFIHVSRSCLTVKTEIRKVTRLGTRTPSHNLGVMKRLDLGTSRIIFTDISYQTFTTPTQLSFWRQLNCVREDINTKKTFFFGHCPNHLNLVECLEVSIIFSQGAPSGWKIRPVDWPKPTWLGLVLDRYLVQKCGNCSKS